MNLSTNTLLNCVIWWMPSDTTGGRDRLVMCWSVTSPVVFDLLSLARVKPLNFTIYYARRTILNFLFKNDLLEWEIWRNSICITKLVVENYTLTKGEFNSLVIRLFHYWSISSYQSQHENFDFCYISSISRSRLLLCLWPLPIGVGGVDSVVDCWEFPTLHLQQLWNSPQALF